MSRAPIVPAHPQRIALVDWDCRVEQRPVVLAQSTLPPYLLLPEVHALLDQALHANHHLMLNTLWHTGARISECLDLTRQAFHLDGERSHVLFKFVEQHAAGDLLPRQVPVTDAGYLVELERYFVTQPLAPGDRLFTVGRHGAAKRIRTLVERAEAMSGSLPIKVTPHTLRHSFAVNAVLHGVPLSVIKQWLGHRHIQSTEIYAQVLAAETEHLMRWVAF